MPRAARAIHTAAAGRQGASPGSPPACPRSLPRHKGAPPPRWPAPQKERRARGGQGCEGTAGHLQQQALPSSAPSAYPKSTHLDDSVHVVLRFGAQDLVWVANIARHAHAARLWGGLWVGEGCRLPLGRRRQRGQQQERQQEPRDGEAGPPHGGLSTEAGAAATEGACGRWRCSGSGGGEATGVQPSSAPCSRTAGRCRASAELIQSGMGPRGVGSRTLRGLSRLQGPRVCSNN